MSDQKEQMEVFLDFLSNQPKNDQTRWGYRELLRHRFEERLSDSVERIWELPAVLLSKPNAEYLTLLLEARQLYLDGYFYSCVAMCGIVGERLIKDVFRACVLVQKNGHPQVPAETAFDQFEHVEVSGIIKFLEKADLLSPEAASAATKLGEVRNRYVHARGKEPDSDALRSIKFLHTLIEGTVSVMKDFEFKDGALVRKTNSPESKS